MEHSYFVIYLQLTPLLVKLSHLINPMSLMRLLLTQILDESKFSNYAENYFLKLSLILSVVAFVQIL